MQKILGLDIGSYSIKAVEITNTFKTYKVTQFYENIIPEIEGLDQSIIGMTAVKQLFAENEIEVDRTYTAIMGLLASIRILQLQNVKKRMVPQIVLSELEGHAPISLDDVVVDQQILGTVNNQSNVLAVLSRRDQVEAYLNGLKDLGIEPKVIDVDYLTYMNLYPFIDLDEGPAVIDAKSGSRKVNPAIMNKTRMILDIGHLKTSVVMFHNGKLAAARTIRMGGRYFTDFLQKTLGITFNEAQRVKHAVSRVEYKAGGKAEVGHEREFFVAKNITTAVSELVKELLRTLHSFRAQEKLVPEVIYLTGGSAAISGLTDYLQEALGVPVKIISFDNARLKIEDENLQRPVIMGQALAIALRGVPGKEQSAINLRRGELAVVGAYDAVIRQTSNIALLFASLLVVLFASYTLRWWLYGRQIDALKKEYHNQVLQILGTEPKSLKNLTVSNNWDLKNYSNQANTYINGEINARETLLSAYSNRQSAIPLRALNEISKVIPKDTLIDVTNFGVSGNSITLDGETDSFSSSEKILGLIKSITEFQGVELKSQEPKPGTDGKVIKFTIVAVLKEAV